MKIPSDCDPLAWGERRYVQPVMTSATTWSNEPSFGMTLSSTSAIGPPYRAPYSAFDGKGSYGANYGWGHYGDGEYTYHALMEFEHPLKILGVVYGTFNQAYRRYSDFYGVEDDGTEVPQFHVETNYGGFVHNVRCENPRYFKRYKWVQRFDGRNGGWAGVHLVKLDALYRPADLQG